MRDLPVTHVYFLVSIMHVSWKIWTSKLVWRAVRHFRVPSGVSNAVMPSLIVTKGRSESNEVVSPRSILCS